nr:MULTISPECIES: DUF4113 domain-containing protein [unclassified Leptolyngbya]
MLELQGYSCIPLETAAAAKQSTAVTRSFGTPVTTLDRLQSALASYASRAAEKLRSQRQVARHMQIFWHTNRHQAHPRSWSVTIALPVDTHDPRDLIHAIDPAVERLYQAGHLIAKAGIILYELQPEQVSQPDLFQRPNPRSKALMRAMDTINRRYGARTIYLAACGTRTPWALKAERRSPRYTTCWRELWTVRS